MLETLERLLDIPSADLATALSLACDAVASATRADKVDAFLFDPARSSLVAIGTSGLGLGLYLARGIAVAHAGDLLVESPPGKGARFQLQLPGA